MPRARVISVVTLVIGMVLSVLVPAVAAPTVSGRLESYNPHTRILVLLRQDGSRRRVKLVSGAKVVWMGRNTTPSAIHKGNEIACRIDGALNDHPLKANLVCDWASSAKYVATAAQAPYFTHVGAYATENGAGGSLAAMPNVPSPMTTIGVMGNGGPMPKWPPTANPATAGSSNPMASGQTGSMPANQGAAMAMPMSRMNAVGGMTNPSMRGTMGANPAQINPMVAEPSLTQMMNSSMDEGTTGASLMGIGGGSSGGSSMMAAGSYGGGGGLQIRGRILSVNPASRTLIIQAYGSPAPQTVVISPTAHVQMKALRPGTMVMVSGVASGQAIEAFSVVQAR